MKVDPQPEHRWLQQLVGEWTYESECAMGPDKPAMKVVGTERARMLGDVWLVAEGEGRMPDDGGTGRMIITLGYDPAKRRFVGSWIGSMMANMWVYEGALDAGGKILTLDTQGPGCSGDGGIGRYQDIVEIVDADHRVLRSRALAEDGTWNEFMTARYRRRT